MTTHGELTADQFERLGKEFAVDPKNRLLQNALTRNEVDEIAMDRALAVSAERSMSHQLDDWAATNQKQSGRCWLFAGLNLLRVSAARKMDLAEFEFSQNHLLFWDKLEKANFWLEGVIATSDRDVDDRTVAHLMGDPIGDGGQWNMFVALVRKHGLVPKSGMPETVASSSTRQLNRDLKVVLRQAARDLRDRAAADVSLDDLRDQKDDTLRTVHRMLSLHLGSPPGDGLVAVDGQGQGLPPRRDDHPAGVRPALRRPRPGFLRLPGRRPSTLQPSQPRLHRRASRQRRERETRHLSQRRDALDEATGSGVDRRWHSCVVRL